MIEPPLVALIATLLVMTAGGVWKLSRVESALRKDITDSKQEIEEKQGKHSREFGETIAALRQHINNFQLEVANNYVRRDGFNKIRDELVHDISRLGDELKSRLERMETKLDEKT